MRAVVMQGLHRPLAVATMPDPTPLAGEVVVSIGRCGICRSDLHMTEDATYGAGAGTVLGHEFAGEVVALGAGVTGLKTGDTVAVSPLASCGHCDACRRGAVQWCAHFGRQAGGYAEYAVTRPNQCVRLPASASIADGAIIEPLAVALHGVNLAGLRGGERVLVLGAGPIGLAVAFWARRQGAAAVVVQDLALFQQERAMAMGATGFVADPDDPVGAAQRALGGSADVVFECVGVPGLIDQAGRQVANRGRIVLLGLCTRPDSISTFALLQKEVTLITSAFFLRQEYEAALDALAGGAEGPRHLVTDTISLAATPDRFEALRRRTGDCKVLIAPAS